MALIAAGCARPPACYHADSDGRGWKRVALPPEAPHLAAAPAIDQLRGAEPMTMWSDWRDVSGSRERAGTSRYMISVGALDQVVELQFGARLGGSAVEVIGWRGYESYPVLSRQRSHDASFVLPVDEGTGEVVVLVHHHMRAAPEMKWRSGWREGLPPPALNAAGTLYYYDPGEGPVELCEAPSRPLGARFARLAAAGESPRQAALRATPLTRLFH